MSTLIDEITQADQDLRTAEAETTEASKRLRQCKHRLKTIRAELSRLILELKTGESRYPLIERFTASGETLSPNGAAIETDLARLPDAESDADADVNLEWTSADLERELLDALKRVGPAESGGRGIWADLKRTGCDDAKILEVLRSIWPASYLALAGTGPSKHRQVAKTVHGGPTPAFWMGARKSTDWKLAPPTLQGLQLADRIRRVLAIPRAAAPADPEPPRAAKPSRARRTSH